MINFIKGVVRIKEIKKALLSPNESLSHHRVLNESFLKQAQSLRRSRRKKMKKILKAAAPGKRKRRNNKERKRMDKLTLAKSPFQSILWRQRRSLPWGQIRHSIQDDQMQAVSKKIKEPMENRLPIILKRIHYITWMHMSGYY